MGKSKRDAKKARKATLKTVRYVNDYLYTVEYKADYALDVLLERGQSNMAQLIVFVQRALRDPRAVLSPVIRGGCSTFNAKTPEGDVILGRNFDYKDAPCVVVWTAPENGYKSLAVADATYMAYGLKRQQIKNQRKPMRILAAPYTSMDGINEKGLAAAVLEIKAKSTKQDTGKTPITTTVALRAFLDKCATVEECIALLQQYDMHAPMFVNYHYQFADAAGNSALVEYVDNKMYVIRQSAPDEPLALTNFFLTEGGDNSKEMGRDRFENISACLASNPTLTEHAAMDLLSENTLYYHHDWMPHMVTTLWSAVYNCTDRTMLLCTGMDYEKRYRFSLDRPGVWTLEDH